MSMRKILFLAISLLPLFLVASLSGAEVDYSPPIPIITREAFYPVNSVALGMVSLVVVVEEDGRVSKVNVLNPIASLDEPSIGATKQWKFEPAKIDGNPIRSQAIINFIYGHAPSPTKSAFVAASSTPAAEKYIPPVPTMVHEALYAINSAGSGTVSFTVMVEEDGRVSDVKVVKSLAPLNEPSIRAIKQWKFEPARINGSPVRSKTNISFVYVPYPYRRNR